MSVYKTVCVSMCACVCVSLSVWVHIFSFNLIKKLHQKPSGGGCAYTSTKLAAAAGLPTSS